MSFRIVLSLGALTALSATPGCSCGSARILVPDGGSDAVAPPVVSLDPVGTWDGCSSTWAFESDGTVTFTHHMLGCMAAGTWIAGPSSLDLEVEPGCVLEPSARLDGVRSGDRLILVGPGVPSGAGLVRRGSALLRTYTLIDDLDPTRRTVVRMIGEPGAGGSGCYWSEDLGCGGLLSCGGTVVSWPDRTEPYSAGTACAGECPCGAVLDVAPSPDGTLAIAYDAVHCMERFSGTATATPR